MKPTQRIIHPRFITDVSWRSGKSSNAFVLFFRKVFVILNIISGDLVLCTITTDMVLRIFAPVLDSPAHLQLQASVAASSLVPISQRTDSNSTRLFKWDPQILEDYIRDVKVDPGTSRRQRLKKILTDDWDLFAVAIIGETFVMRGILVMNIFPNHGMCTEGLEEYRQSTPYFIAPI